MNDAEVLMNPNDLVQFLKKSPEYFTKDDILRFCEENHVEMVNFRYAGGDGKLKTLNFAVSSKEQLDTLLSEGERVDGSKLFSFIEADSSDLYVIPRYGTAFMDPFAEAPTLNILCSYYNSYGQPLASSPEHILRQAEASFKKHTGMEFKCLGELEYYIISKEETFYHRSNRIGYHESGPFCRFCEMRTEAMLMIARAGGKIKYGHAEAGSFTKDGYYYEQHEIEFLTTSPILAVEQILITKWILRRLSLKYGVEVSFAPKIAIDRSGSGLHIHLLAEKNGENVLIKEGKLSDTAKRMIVGILDISDAATGFGNTVPTSYLRLVPNQNAPTYICWGEQNRSVVVRVPLGWVDSVDMVADANFGLKRRSEKSSKQTLEFRVADGSACIYETIACLICGAIHGLGMNGSLTKADELYASRNIFNEECTSFLKTLRRLPISCTESADALISKRKLLERNDIFPPGVIDDQAAKLKAYNDSCLSERLRRDEILFTECAEQYLHIN
ncbi:glutamine synthetase family protein [Methanocorpusculum sp.]